MYNKFLPCKRDAMKAVATLLEHKRTEWSRLYLPSGIQPNITAATAAKKPTTVACTYKKQRHLVLETFTFTLTVARILMDIYTHG